MDSAISNTAPASGLATPAAHRLPCLVGLLLPVRSLGTLGWIVSPHCILARAAGDSCSGLQSSAVAHLRQCSIAPCAGSVPQWDLADWPATTGWSSWCLRGHSEGNCVHHQLKRRFAALLPGARPFPRVRQAASPTQRYGPAATPHSVCWAVYRS